MRYFEIISTEPGHAAGLNCGCRPEVVRFHRECGGKGCVLCDGGHVPLVRPEDGCLVRHRLLDPAAPARWALSRCDTDPALDN